MQLSQRTHGLLNYLLGLITVISPWVFGFSTERAAPQIAVALGVALIFISAISNSEMGILPLLPVPGQRFFDCAIGIALAGASWHFDMKGTAAVVFTLLGIAIFAAAVLTRFPRNPGTV